MKDTAWLERLIEFIDRRIEGFPLWAGLLVIIVLPILFRSHELLRIVLHHRRESRKLNAELKRLDDRHQLAINGKTTKMKDRQERDGAKAGSITSVPTAPRQGGRRK